MQNEQSQENRPTPEQAPDTAVTYERAQPQKHSPGGKLDQEPTTPVKSNDTLQEQNQQPRDPLANPGVAKRVNDRE